MATQSSLGSELKNLCESEYARLQQEFSAAPDGLNYTRGRAALAESIVLRTSPKAPAGDPDRIRHTRLPHLAA